MNNNKDFCDNLTENNAIKERKTRQTITSNILKRIRKSVDKFYTAKQIADDIDISLRAAYNIIDKIAEELTDEEISSKKKERPGNNQNFIKSRISEILLQDSSFTQKEISIELAKFGSRISQSTVFRNLKDVEYTTKRLVRVPIERNS